MKEIEYAALREALMQRVRCAYDVPNDAVDDMYKRAGERHRAFWTMLTRDWLRDPDTNEIVRTPPVVYPQITQEHWDAFIAQREKPEFTTTSEQNKANALKNDARFRGSSGGYRRIIEVYRKEKGLPEDAPVSRHEAYKRAHTPVNKKEKITDFEDQILKNIDDVAGRVESGELVLKPGEDVLTHAFPNPEHPGRVRGVETYVTLKDVFGEYRKAKKENNRKSMKKIWGLFHSLMERLECTEEEKELIVEEYQKFTEEEAKAQKSPKIKKSPDPEEKQDEEQRDPGAETEPRHQRQDVTTVPFQLSLVAALQVVYWPHRPPRVLSSAFCPDSCASWNTSQEVTHPKTAPS